MKESTEPSPLLIISLDNQCKDLSNRIKLHNVNLRKIFLHPNVIDRHMAVLSITGPTRSGKSFLFNLCINYLKNKEFKLTDSDEKLTGFIWGPMKEDRTKGIYIWSEPILFEKSPGNRIAVILMDCQGAFDHVSSMRDTTVIYALSQLFSSLHFFNLSGEMNQEYLGFLTLFANYSNLSTLDLDTQDEANRLLEKVFQKITLVVRNWQREYDYPCGNEGGRNYIDNFLTITDKTSDENQKKIRYFISQYRVIDCFLFPYPGKFVAAKADYKGEWNKMDDSFQESLKEFSEIYLSSDGLIIKEVLGKKVIGREMLIYAENYFNAVISSENPTPITAYDACAKSNHYNALNECLRVYETLMKDRGQYTNSLDTYLNYHKCCKDKAIVKFNEIPKYGVDKYSEKFQLELESQIEDEFVKFYQMVPVESLSILPIMKTVSLTIIILFVLYILSKLFRILSMANVSNIIDIVIMIIIALMLIFCCQKFNKFYQTFDVSQSLQNALISNNQ